MKPDHEKKQEEQVPTRENESPIEDEDEEEVVVEKKEEQEENDGRDLKKQEIPHSYSTTTKDNHSWHEKNTSSIKEKKKDQQQEIPHREQRDQEEEGNDSETSIDSSISHREGAKAGDGVGKKRSFSEVSSVASETGSGGHSENGGGPPSNGELSSCHRTTRYLKEKERLQILERIKNGEKQADLAKEYQVSRAAISNLKQRRRKKAYQEALASAQTLREISGQLPYQHDGGGGYNQRSMSGSLYEQVPLHIPPHLRNAHRHPHQHHRHDSLENGERYQRKINPYTEKHRGVNSSFREYTHLTNSSYPIKRYHSNIHNEGYHTLRGSSSQYGREELMGQSRTRHHPSQPTDSQRMSSLMTMSSSSPSSSNSSHLPHYHRGRETRREEEEEGVGGVILAGEGRGGRGGGSENHSITKYSSSSLHTTNSTRHSTISSNASTSSLVYELHSSSVDLLLTLVKDERTSDREFAIGIERISRLLFEEATGRLPCRNVEMPILSGTICRGIERLKIPCAIPLTEDALLLTKEFQYMEPHAFTTEYLVRSSRMSLSVEVIKRKIPHTIRQYSVFLVGGVSSFDGEYEVMVMQALMEMGVFERDIAFVFVFMTVEALQKLERLFPRVQIYFTSSISPQSSSVLGGGGRGGEERFLTAFIDRCYQVSSYL